MLDLPVCAFLKEMMLSNSCSVVVARNQSAITRWLGPADLRVAFNNFWVKDVGYVFAKLRVSVSVMNSPRETTLLI